MSKRLSVTPFYMRRGLVSSKLLQASGSSPPRPGCRRAAATSAVAVRDRVGGCTHDCARCPFRAVSATQKARRAPALQTRLRGHSERTVREHPVRLIVCISEFHWQRLEILKKKKKTGSICAACRSRRLTRPPRGARQTCSAKPRDSRVRITRVTRLVEAARTWTRGRGAAGGSRAWGRPHTGAGSPLGVWGETSPDWVAAVTVQLCRRAGHRCTLDTGYVCVA